MGNVNDSNNYRGITLTCIIRKLHESVLLTNCEDVLCTAELHFGFKRNTGCLKAVLTLRTVMKYFTSKGSTVFATALDLSKALDRISHATLVRWTERFKPIKNISLINNLL